MSEIISQSERSENNVKDFFIPSQAGVTLFMLLGAILLVIFSSSQIITWLGSNYLAKANSMNLDISILNHGLSNSFNDAFGGRLGQIIVWSLVGALSYITLWLTKNLINSFENDVIIDHYRHPDNYSRAGYWGSAMAGKIFFGAMAIILAAYSYIMLSIIMPAAAALTGNAINNFKLPQSIIYIVLCLLISMVAIYIWTLLAKILSHLWKLL